MHAASDIANLLQDPRLEISYHDLSVLMGYALSKLAVLQHELVIHVADDLGAGFAEGVTLVRNVIVSALSRDEKRSRRLLMLKVPLPFGNWSASDALVGADHSYILSYLEPTSVCDIIYDRVISLTDLRLSIELGNLNAVDTELQDRYI